MTDPLPILNYQTPPEPQRQIPAAWIARMRTGAVLAIISLVLQWIFAVGFNRPIVATGMSLRILGVATAWLLTSRAEGIPVSVIARWIARVFSILLVPVQSMVMQMFLWYVTATTRPAGTPSAISANWRMWYSLATYTYIILLVVAGFCLYLCLYQTLKRLGLLGLARQALALAIIISVLPILPYTLMFLYRSIPMPVIQPIQQMLLYARYPAVAWQIAFLSFFIARLRPHPIG